MLKQLSYFSAPDLFKSFSRGSMPAKDGAGTNVAAEAKGHHMDVVPVIAKARPMNATGSTSATGAGLDVISSTAEVDAVQVAVVESSTSIASNAASTLRVVANMIEDTATAVSSVIPPEVQCMSDLTQHLDTVVDTVKNAAVNQADTIKDAAEKVGDAVLDSTDAVLAKAAEVEETLVNRLRIVANTMADLPEIGIKNLLAFFSVMYLYAIIGMEAQMMTPTGRAGFDMDATEVGVVAEVELSYEKEACGIICPEFTSVGTSLIALFQIFVGAGWSDLMFDSMKHRDSFWPACFFVSFFLLGNILMLGILLAVVMKVLNFETKREETRAVEETRLRETQCLHALQKQQGAAMDLLDVAGTRSIFNRFKVPGDDSIDLKGFSQLLATVFGRSKWLEVGGLPADVSADDLSHFFRVSSCDVGEAKMKPVTAAVLFGDIGERNRAAEKMQGELFEGRQLMLSIDRSSKWLGVAVSDEAGVECAPTKNLEALKAYFAKQGYSTVKRARLSKPCGAVLFTNVDERDEAISKLRGSRPKSQPGWGPLRLSIPYTSAQEVKQIFDKIDVDGSGRIAYPEFYDWWETEGMRLLYEGIEHQDACSHATHCSARRHT